MPIKPAQDITGEVQLERWVAGDPVHRESASGGGCCPDFSCCKAELLADDEIRTAFAVANDAARFRFLGVFLNAAVALANGEREARGDSTAVVHIIGKGEPS